jgi:tetratricopeptide (TPR) repeat protein
MSDAQQIPLDVKVFAFLCQAIEAQRRGNLPVAGKLIEIAIGLIDGMPDGEADGFRALALCLRTQLRKKENRPDDAARDRQDAMALVDRISKSHFVGREGLAELMSRLLMDLQEYRRAIPFCERAVEQAVEANDPIVVAKILSRQAHSYSYCGLKDQAAIPFRAALKIIRNYPQEPILTEILIGLGNALRKSSPGEAEALYKEAADIYLAKAHVESATVPWVNLGILCGEEGRYAESLEYYHKALEVREKSTTTSAIQLALLLNNIANCHRRSRNFEEALRLIDRSIEMLARENTPKIASAYGSKGQILHDASRDVEAVEWLRKAHVERQKQPSPDYDLMLENLGYEVDSLKRLGRAEDVAEAEARMDQAREAMKAVPGAKVDVSTLSAEPAGAVLVELAFALRPGSRYSLRDVETVLEQAYALLSGAELATNGSRVITPESITLIFYGENGEKIFEAMEQFLSDRLIFAGAIVSIRQGKGVRQTVIPGSVN